MHITVEKIADGLGIGEGSISGDVINEAAGTETVKRVDDAIHSPNIIVPIDRDKQGRVLDDDGCGDGRFTKLIMRGRERLGTSLHRAKVFGGGATMGMATLIGAGSARGTLKDVFGQSMQTLREKNIKFGAHTADHTAEGKCGCGAIDESPSVVRNTVKYRSEIYSQFDALGVTTDGLDEVLDNFASYAGTVANQPFQGKTVMEAIQKDEDVIVKELGGPHIESRIVLNFVRGTTVNQQYIREISGGKIDVFGVDVWRMQAIAHRLHPRDETAEQQAFQGMLVYTLATAAVLTKGNLPVYAVKPEQAEEDMQLAA